MATIHRRTVLHHLFPSLKTSTKAKIKINKANAGQFKGSSAESEGIASKSLFG
jgi:hypothetical protein